MRFLRQVLISLALLVGVAGKHIKPKRILVLGGIMKSHHLAMVPAIEELAKRGHDVTFALPNTEEARLYFPTGLNGVHVVHFGQEQWSIASMFNPDIKNMPWYEKILAIAEHMWKYRDMLDRPLCSMLEDFTRYIETSPPDLVFSSFTSFALNRKLYDLGSRAPPAVQLFSTTPIPELVMSDKDMLFRYPNMFKPSTVQELKSSLLVRISNRLYHYFMYAQISFSARELSAIMTKRGLSPVGSISQHLSEAPLLVTYGGPPMSLGFPIPENVHMVGIAERPKPRDIEPAMLAWLEQAAAEGDPVVYVSMGTKYELSNTTGAQLVAELGNLISGGARVLWSLRERQQEALGHLLHEQGTKLRIEAFTSQPEVLKHRAVKVFVSHCGWGGVMDSLTAGVPILAYPGFGDQFSNAHRLLEVGAGLLVRDDFADLVADAQRMIQEPGFASAAQAAGEKLRALGGLDRLVDILEAASEGNYSHSPAEGLTMMADIDPFFLEPQELERAICVAILTTACGLLLAACLLCCTCCRRCCSSSCRRAAKQKAA